jgi:hypothetical protein
VRVGESVAALAFAAACCLLVRQRIRRAAISRRLAERRAGRSAAKGLDLARSALVEFPASRVDQAFLWVQELVPATRFPVYPEESLLGCLEIQQSDVDEKFEACYDCFGEEEDEDAAASRPMQTAEQLMRAVLESGYENYPKPPTVLRVGLTQAAQANGAPTAVKRDGA